MQGDDNLLKSATLSQNSGFEGGQGESGRNAASRSHHLADEMAQLLSAPGQLQSSNLQHIQRQMHQMQQQQQTRHFKQTQLNLSQHQGPKSYHSNQQQSSTIQEPFMSNIMAQPQRQLQEQHKNEQLEQIVNELDGSGAPATMGSTSTDGEHVAGYQEQHLYGRRARTGQEDNSSLMKFETMKPREGDEELPVFGRVMLAAPRLIERKEELHQWNESDKSRFKRHLSFDSMDESEEAAVRESSPSFVTFNSDKTHNEHAAIERSEHDDRFGRPAAPFKMSSPYNLKQLARGAGLAPSVSCERLAAFWVFLQSAYPVLSSHLLEWASQMRGGKQSSDPQSLWASSAPSMRSIGNLLDSAERIMAAASGIGDSDGDGDTGDRSKPRAGKQLFGGNINNNIRHHHNDDGGNRNPQPAWLARVTSNPFYAKLIQHLRSRQLAEAAHNHQREPLAHPAPQSIPQRNLASSSSQQASGVAAHNTAPAGNEMGATSAKTTTPNGNDVAGEGADEQMNAAASQHQLDSDRGIAYGHLIYYPHEFSQADSSSRQEDTISKLHTLDRSRKLQEQQSQQQTRVNGNDENRDIGKNNKIPLTAGTHQITDSRRKLIESADAARDNFVYGTVLLEPPKASRNLDQQDSHKRPMKHLKELSSELERERLFGLTNGQPTSNGGGGEMAQPLMQSSPAEAFGRVLMSPPNSKNQNENNDKSSQGVTASSLNGAIVANGASDNRGLADELASQQAAHQMAFDVSGGGGGASTGVGEIEVTAASMQNGGEEFEGEFHSEPFRQAEVRLLRSLDHRIQDQNQHHQRQQQQNDQQQQQQAHALFSNANVELITRGAEFFID